MWKYEKPEMEVGIFNNLDVICTSGVGVTDGGIIENGAEQPGTPFVPPTGGSTW